MSGGPDVEQGAAATNRLAGETSPYLLQHSRNPVDWYPWGPEALERARREDKPIFLSIGYAACHWCHVMAHESFEDARTAELLNREFVSIKVDREERPDLDDVYMTAVQAMTGGGGWPMSVFLTPKLEPFFGGTYFPPDDRHGLPAFRTVLAGVAEAYRTRRDEVDVQAAALAGYLRRQLAPGQLGRQADTSVLDAAVARLGASFDRVHGGFGPMPKFPPSMALEFLLRAWRRTDDEGTLRMVTVTLDAMLRGGIHDQLGGGFARYSTDAAWLVPHFEKMLYDNALLAHCYLEAFRATGEDRYREVVVSTLDFLLGELATPDGGFASSLDADSEGEEGRYYVWTAAEVRERLAAGGLSEAAIAAVMRYWDVTPAGNWDGRAILHVTGGEPPAALPRARELLRQARASRPRPGRDDKVLTAWNGLALRALASAGAALGMHRYLAAADRLVDFARSVLLRPDGRLWRTASGRRAHTAGFLEDYACLADGLLATHAAWGRTQELRLAVDLMDRAVDAFWDPDAGLFWDTSQEHDALPVRPRSLADAATPSGNAVAADVLLRLALVTGRAEDDRRARQILAAGGPAMAQQPTVAGRLLCAADRAANGPVDAVIAALGEDDPAAEKLRHAAHEPYAPDLVVASTHPGDTVGWPLFAGKVPLDDRATAYVCRAYACEAPTGEPATVAGQVAQLARIGTRTP